jgi:hypothetical protein
MRTVLLIVGVLAILVGGLWLGQGLGYVHWPASSFMINQMKWAYYGAGLAVVGLLIVMYSRRDT